MLLQRPSGDLVFVTGKTPYHSFTTGDCVCLLSLPQPLPRKHWKTHCATCTQYKHLPYKQSYWHLKMRSLLLAWKCLYAFWEGRREQYSSGLVLIIHKGGSDQCYASHRLCFSWCWAELPLHWDCMSGSWLSTAFRERWHLLVVNWHSHIAGDNRQLALSTILIASGIN